MQIRVGFEMGFDSPQPTPMIFNLNVHYTRVSDLVSRDNLLFDPPVPTSGYRDGFGNWCTRIVAPRARSGSHRMPWSMTAAVPTPTFPRRVKCPWPTSPRNPSLFAGQPVLRDRQAVADSVGPLRAATNGMGSGAGHLRLRPSAPRVRLSTRWASPLGAAIVSRPALADWTIKAS